MLNIPYKNLLIIGLSMSLILSINQCTENKKLVNSQNAALLDKTNHFRNDIGTITATKKVLELQKNDLKELVYAQDTTLNKLQAEFVNVKNVVQSNTVVEVDSVTVPFTMDLPYDFKQQGKHINTWLQFEYAINQNEVSIRNLTIPNKQTTITGFKRKWLLGKQTYTTDITHTNPHMKTTEVQTIEVVVPKRFYDTRLFNIGIGLIGGMLITK